MENIDPRAIMDEVTAEVRANLKTLCREQYDLSNTAVLPPDALTRKIAAKAAVVVKSEALRVVQRLIETEAMNAIAFDDVPVEENKDADQDSPDNATYAFWSYDLYPYFVGGPVSMFDKEGNRAYVPSYQMWRRMDDKTFIVANNGRVVYDMLDRMSRNYYRASTDLHNEYVDQLSCLLPDPMRSVVIRRVRK